VYGVLAFFVLCFYRHCLPVTNRDDDDLDELYLILSRGGYSQPLFIVSCIVQFKQHGAN